MDRGPAWAKANLSPEKLKDIEHFIDLQEQILFRCPQSKPLVEIVDGEEGAAPAPTKPKKTLAKATASPADDAAPAAKAPKKAAAAPAKAAGAVATTPAPVKKSPPKPKPSDAYIPPVKLDGE
jgi:hypothetical protein